METALLALGFARETVLQLIPLFQRLAAESRDPAPEEIAVLKSAQRVEESEFNSDLGK